MRKRFSRKEITKESTRSGAEGFVAKAPTPGDSRAQLRFRYLTITNSKVFGNTMQAFKRGE